MKTITLGILILFVRGVMANMLISSFLSGMISRFRSMKDLSWRNKTARRHLIIGGEQAVLGDLPYQVSFCLREKKNESMADVMFCGGTLISTSQVLSAAHCFHYFADRSFTGRLEFTQLKRIRAVAGTVENLQQLDSVTPPTQVRRLDTVVYFRYFSDVTQIYNDIAVVTLRTPFEETYAVKHIKYAMQWKEYYGSCLASGFGSTEESQIMGKHLYKADLPIMTTRECSARTWTSSRDFVCTTLGYSETTQGDAGGPLVCQDTDHPNESPLGILVGVTTGTFPRLGIGMFTRTSSHRNFIASNKAHTTTYQYSLHPAFIGIMVTCITKATYFVLI